MKVGLLEQIRDFPFKVRRSLVRYEEWAYTIVDFKLGVRDKIRDVAVKVLSLETLSVLTRSKVGWAVCQRRIVTLLFRYGA